ncbi:HAD family hydrolase [Gloeomargarita lithophora Alchichica-D10]|uniref:HAD family hydrolase n=1 Tax=Gloeomargarita lithophora Alchichica-D10 TaxID=1188229 RepID=A0A1J0AGW3_9CYAN|nr:HAD family hydrolase [Gloeomargarita lithophora]APB35131.1 HAD family hydrolase [Gloeomargarita lithophora Alchichica-D10]
MATLAFNGVKFSQIQAVIWDKDGTLADTVEYWRLVGHQRVRRLDAQIPGVGVPLQAAFGLTDSTLEPGGLLAVGSRYENEIAAAAYIAEQGKDWRTALALAQEVFRQVEQECPGIKTIPIRTGGKEILSQLQQAGCKQAILSADLSVNVTAFVQHNQLEDWLDYYTGIDVGPTKPDPEPLYQTCTALGLAPAQVVMVGDSPVDLEMARRAGCAGAIGVSWGFHPAQGLTSLADAVITDWSQIQVLG